VNTNCGSCTAPGWRDRPELIQFHGKIAGSPLEDGSGFVSGRQGLALLARNGWFTVEQTVSELRIRRGERARRFNEGSST
jgi:hypothetical protein